MLRFFLNNIQVQTEPQINGKLRERLYYSEDLKTNLSEITGNLIFYASERDYIFSVWQTSSCGMIPIEIQKQRSNGQWSTEFKGFILTSDVVFYDSSNSVECEIVDNSFIAMIDNNKGLEMNLGVPLSKNGVDISSYYTTNPLGEVFTHTGGGTYSNRLVISVYDAFAALIAFMTDGTVLFHSDFFDYTAPDWTEGNNYHLINGSELATGDGEILPTISFEDLFRDQHRAYNLQIGIEVANSGKPLIRIEPKSYFRNSNQITLQDVKDVSYQRKLGNQYTKILVGNDFSDEANTLPIFDYLWNTWHTKEYILQGMCNDVDSELNLQFETLCADVRAINAVGAGTVTEDDGIFLYAEAIHDGGANEFWNPFELYIPGVTYNNKSTRNGMIIDRWEGDIFSPVAQYDYFLNDMRVERTTQQVIGAFEDIVFDNDSTNGNFDNGSTYNNTNGQYTVKVTGTYKVRFAVTLLSSGGNSTFELGFGFGFNGGLTGIGWYYPGQSTSTPITLLSGQSGSYEMEYEIPLLEGTDIGGLFDAVITVQVNKTAGSGTLTVEAGSTFEVVTANSGVFREFSANESFSKEINANLVISDEDWESIKSDRSARINLAGAQRIYQGYGLEIDRDIESGETTLRLLGKPNVN